MTTTYCPRCLSTYRPDPHTCTPHPAAEELDSLKMQVASHLSRIGELESYADGIAETQDLLTSENSRLRAENADLTQQLVKEQLSVQRFAGENARLREAVVRLLTHADDEYYGHAAAEARAAMEVGK